MYPLEQILAAIAHLRDRLPDLLGAERWPAFERDLEGYLADLSAARQDPTTTKLRLLHLFMAAPAARIALLALIDPTRLGQESTRHTHEPAESAQSLNLQSLNLQSPNPPPPPATPTSPARAASGSALSGWPSSCG